MHTQFETRRLKTTEDALAALSFDGLQVCLHDAFSRFHAKLMTQTVTTTRADVQVRQHISSASHLLTVHTHPHDLWHCIVKTHDLSFRISGA